VRAFGFANIRGDRGLFAAFVGITNSAILLNFLVYISRACLSKPLNIRLSVFAQDRR
jgi:hypothetical protein